MSRGGLICSFCGKNEQQVKRVIAGPTVYICDECVGVCVDILEDDGIRFPITATPKPMRVKPLEFPLGKRAQMKGRKK